MLTRLQAQIERVPSGIRRILVALAVLAVLAFLFPLRDDDQRLVTDGILTPQPSATAAPTRPAATPAPQTQQTSGGSATGVSSSPSSPALPTPELAPVSESCEPSSDWPVYVVRRGDTLDGIARLASSTIVELTQANCLQNPNRLDVGQEIRVPRLPGMQGTPAMTIPTARTAVPQPTRTPPG